MFATKLNGYIIYVRSLNIIVSFLSFELVFPIGLELLFRGLFLNGFLKNHRVKKSVFVSSLMFAVIQVRSGEITAGLALIYGILKRKVITA